MNPVAAVTCSRCAHEAPRMAKPPVPGPTGEEVQARVCADCWAEWEKAEVMVINELRLDFMDPRSLDVLERHLREFLFLD